MTIKNILVPIDFSKNSINALRWGCNLAKKSGAKLHVLHTYEYSATYAQENYLTFMESIADSVTKNLLKDMKQLEKEVEELSNLKPNYEISFNFALKGITDYIDQHKVDFVVMGTRGNNNLTNKLMGSITAAVIDRTQVPVLAIPENHRLSDVKNIVFAVDYKHLTKEKTISILVSIAKLYDAQVKILHVAPEKDENASVETDEVLKISKELKSVEHSYAFSVNDNPDEGIINFLAKDKADMLAILPQKHGFFHNIFKKSVTEEVVNQIQIPMLSLKSS